MKLCHHWRRRRARIEESEAALRRQERLGEYIELQQQEAAEVSSWARERLELNHLTEMFLSLHQGGRAS